MENREDTTTTTQHRGNHYIAVCIFAYYEKNEEYRENLQHFLTYGLRDDVMFYFVINGEKCSITFPTNQPNIKVLKRGVNTGYDFGAWQYCIHQEKIGFLPQSTYSYYIFINSSVRGPIPSTLGGKWLEHFLLLFNDPEREQYNEEHLPAPEVHLVGTTINIHMDPITTTTTAPSPPPPHTHVQSMFFILDNTGYQYLTQQSFWADDHILNDPNTSLSYVQIEKEIKMSQIILKKNWNINCILPHYRGKDYTKVKDNFNPYSQNPYRTCLDSPESTPYFGKTIQPEEVIFYKTNLSCIQ